MLKPTREGGIGNAFLALLSRTRRSFFPFFFFFFRQSTTAGLIWQFEFAVNRSLVVYSAFSALLFPRFGFICLRSTDGAEPIGFIPFLSLPAAPRCKLSLSNSYGGIRNYLPVLMRTSLPPPFFFFFSCSLRPLFVCISRRADNAQRGRCTDDLRRGKQYDFFSSSFFPFPPLFFFSRSESQRASPTCSRRGG